MNRVDSCSGTEILDNIDELNNYVLEVKKFIFTKMNIYTLSRDESTEFKYMKYSVLSSWFENIKTYEDFKIKFDAFEKILNNSDVKRLFSIIKCISLDVNGKENSDKKESVLYLKEAKDLFNKINNDKEYNYLSSFSGFKLSDKYLDDRNYLDNSLRKNLAFISILYNYLVRVNKTLNSLKVVVCSTEPYNNYYVCSSAIVSDSERIPSDNKENEGNYKKRNSSGLFSTIEYEFKNNEASFKRERKK